MPAHNFYLDHQLTLFGTISRTLDNLNKVRKEDLTRQRIQGRLEALRSNWTRFQSNHLALEEIRCDADDKLAAELKKAAYYTQDTYSKVEETFLDIQEQMLCLLEEVSISAPVDGAALANTSAFNMPERVSHSRRLPRIDLPKFSGDSAEWGNYRDLFTSMVGSDPQLTCVEKLHYLKLSLGGNAAQRLKNFAVTGENFQRAWDALYNYYENKRALVDHYLSAFLDVAPVVRESSAEIERLHSEVTQNITALQALDRPIEYWDDFLVTIIVRKLDRNSLKDWERELGANSDPPSMQDLEAFLLARIRSLQAYERATLTSHNHKPRDKGESSGAKTHHAAKPAGSTCTLCQGTHYIALCSEYQSKNPEQRREFVSQQRLCFNCLGRHRIKDCRNNKRCQACGAQHHTSLHQNKQSTVLANPQTKELPSTSRSNTTTQAASVNAVISDVLQSDNFGHVSSVLLATAIVNIIARNGESCEVRVLLDQGSEVSLVTENLAQRLRLTRSRASIPIVGIGDRGSQSTNGEVTLTLQSRINSFSCKVQALVLTRLTGCLPSEQVSYQQWNHIRKLSLADPEFYRSRKIDMILGARIYALILEEGLIKGSDNAPVAQKTSLGWILSGPVPSTPPHRTAAHSLHCSADRELTEILQRFWLQEEAFSPMTGELSEEEDECEKYYVATHQRDSSGRYVVRLPIRRSVEDLGESFSAALRLLQRMENRFAKEPQFHEAYLKFLQEYEGLGHMTRCSDSSMDPRNYYLPHHGVIKESSATTKLRVVFNGSQKTRNGISLNDCLHVGPKVLVNLVDVLLRWGCPPFVFSADIVKMFRQVLVHPKDRDLQRILWRSSPTSPVEAYQLNTLAYGTGPAPYLAIRTLRQLAEDEGHRFPLAVRVINEETYVDNIHSGADTIEEGRKKIHHTLELLMAGRFPLQQWIANDDDLLEDIPESLRATMKSKSFEEEPLFQALGLSWQPRSDSFVFISKVNSETSVMTKRSVLSRIAQCFDPLGWLAPVIVRAKMLMQELWTVKLDWDDELPDNLASRWKEFIYQLPQVSQFTVPRWLGLSSKVTAIELHGFSDASRLALGAVIYIRVVNQSDDINVSLISAKTKVAPIKRENDSSARPRVVRVTTPRLELSAAVLLVRHLLQVRQALRLEHVPVHLWTDSTHHVDGVDNPADCASRGVSPHQLTPQHLWWNGPSWLRQYGPLRANLLLTIDNEVDLEERKKIVSTIRVDPSSQLWDIIDRYSSWTKLIKITAWCLRFIATCKGRENSEHKFLTASELGAARIYWIRAIQQAYFAAELLLLAQAKQLPKNNPLIRLTPFVDENGLLRIGGRLRNSLLDPDTRHPLILPRVSQLTFLIIDHVHKLTLHGGTQVMLATIRRNYWIIGGRISVRSFVLKCVTCARYRASKARQLMGQLPEPRVKPSRPFLHTGIDYAGPFELKTWRGRAAKKYKGYIVLSVCLATSALHLDVVTDYSTEGFLAAYRRFTGRRGVCATLYSDCGTNLVGADAELRRLFSAASRDLHQLATLLAQDGTEWKFNPPSAPHFGGKWKAGVKSVKFHLRRVIGDTSLTYEEFTTLLIQIEAVLNSRPLSPLSDDPDDLDALTPAHFLIGTSITTIPEPTLIDVKISRLSRWQLLRHMTERFWERWSTEYLQHLQGISKWHYPSQEIQVGSLVLVADERYPPSKWPMARVTQTHPGTDGLVRVATVKTQVSTLTRPIVKLCLLPVSNSDSTSTKISTT